MRRLLAADWVRFGRRADIRLLVLLVPVIMGALYVAEFNAVTTQPSLDFFIDPPDAVLEAELRRQALDEWRRNLATLAPAFAFPGSLLKVAGNIVVPILLAIYLSVALTAGEFEWGTVRTLHLTSPRGRTLAVRLLVIVGLLVVVFLIAMVLGTILPFLLNVDGVPLQSLTNTTPDLPYGIALRFAMVLPFIAIPALLSVLTRSISIGFLLMLLFIAADLALAASPFWTTSPVPWLPALSLTGSINRLLSPESVIARAVPAGVSLAALLAWGLLPMVAAVARFRRMDLNE